jgi:hypothetical protein
VFQMCEGEAGRCSKRFDSGRPWLLGDGLSSQSTKVRPNVSTAVAANLADEQTFDIRQPQMVALAHLQQRSRLARSCTKVVGGCFIAARSTSLGVLQRAHLISSQEKPPLTARSIVGDGSIGSPSDRKSLCPVKPTLMTLAV